MNRTRSKHSAVDGQTLPERRPQTKDGQAPVPRVREESITPIGYESLIAPFGSIVWLSRFIWISGSSSMKVSYITPVKRAAPLLFLN